MTARDGEVNAQSACNDNVVKFERIMARILFVADSCDGIVLGTAGGTASNGWARSPVTGNIAVGLHHALEKPIEANCQANQNEEVQVHVKEMLQRCQAMH